MYEELVKRLRNRRICIQKSGGLDDFPLLQEAADAIEELSKRVDESIPKDDAEIIIAEVAKPRWIPVTEEPPLKVGDDGYNGYLVYANGYYEVADYTTGKFDNVPYFYVNGEYDPDVTHYMSLPEPPKEE